MKYLMAVLCASLALPVFSQGLILADYGAGVLNAPGWKWTGFADRVMGGRSDLMQPSVVETPQGKALRLAGKVVTKGGGFIQVRLGHQGGKFDASMYAGVELVVSAPPGGRYFTFLRTADNFFPWSYYAAPLDLNGSVQTIRLPWSSFKAEAVDVQSPRVKNLESLALVAGFLDFEADLKIYRLGLYR